MASPLEVVILAGGQGTRLRSVTGLLPKALVPVAGRPILDWKLEQLSDAGVARVHLLVGFGADDIDAHLAMHPPPLPVAAYRDGSALLGTGGAIVACSASLPERFVVTYGDSLLDEPLSPFWEAFIDSDYAGLLAITQQFDSELSGNVALEGDRVARYAKDPSGQDLAWLDYGYLALNRETLSQYFGVTPLDLGTVVSDLAAARQLGAYRVTHPFWEVGTPASLELVEQHLAEIHQS